jgi:hypothetical protein
MGGVNREIPIQFWFNRFLNLHDIFIRHATLFAKRLNTISFTAALGRESDATGLNAKQER